MKIENKAVGERAAAKSDLFQEFISTLGKLEPGQSFVVGELPSHYRVAISVAQTLLGRKYACRKEDGQFRVGAV